MLFTIYPIWGGKTTIKHQPHAPIRIKPHSRTLRKARIQVQLMVITGFSTRRIRSYLYRFFIWWTNTTKIWSIEELAKWFCDSCFDSTPANYATGVLYQYLTKSNSSIVYDLNAARSCLDTLAG